MDIGNKRIFVPSRTSRYASSKAQSPPSEPLPRVEEPEEPSRDVVVINGPKEYSLVVSEDMDSVSDDVERSITLSPTQQVIVDRIIKCASSSTTRSSGKDSIFVTGAAGTGKTAVMKAAIEALYRRNCPIVVVAPTGKAAMNIKTSKVCASTIHSAFMFPINQSLAIKGVVSQPQLEKKMRARIAKFQKKRKTDPSVDEKLRALERCKVLLVDEVSMLSKQDFYFMDWFLRILLSNSLPFGGIPVVFCGDPMQLPPVVSTNQGDSYARCQGLHTVLPISDSIPQELRHMSANGQGFIFELRAWETLIGDRVYMLTEIQRQQDECYVKILNQIRLGYLKPEYIPTLLNRIEPCPYDPELKDTLVPPILCTTRKDSDAINSDRLRGLPGASNTYHASHNMSQSEYDQLKGQIPVPETLELKVGSQVVATKNMRIMVRQSREDPPIQLYIANGTRGIVTDFKLARRGKDIIDCEGRTQSATESYLPVVQFEEFPEHGIVMQHARWEFSDDTQQTQKNVKKMIEQLPLAEAWARTIHFVQGSTLHVATLHAGPNEQFFTGGQLYVGLSRAKTLEGLTLLGFDVKNVQVNRMALWYVLKICQKQPQIPGEIVEYLQHEHSKRSNPSPIQKYPDVFSVRGPIYNADIPEACAFQFTDHNTPEELYSSVEPAKRRADTIVATPPDCLERLKRYATDPR